MIENTLIIKKSEKSIKFIEVGCQNCGKKVMVPSPYYGCVFCPDCRKTESYETADAPEFKKSTSGIKMKTNIVIVDGTDNIIGSKPRDIVDKEKLKYRVSGLWIKNSNGESLLARRAYTKTHYPGRWGPAVAGTIDEGESYRGNIIKEAKEELGLQDIEIEEASKIQTSGEYNHFTQWFISIIDKPSKDFKIQEEEVVEVKWFSKEELLEQLKNNPKEFVPKMKEYFDMFIGEMIK